MNEVAQRVRSPLIRTRFEHAKDAPVQRIVAKPVYLVDANPHPLPLYRLDLDAVAFLKQLQLGLVGRRAIVGKRQPHLAHAFGHCTLPLAHSRLVQLALNRPRH